MSNKKSEGKKLNGEQARKPKIKRNQLLTLNALRRMPRPRPLIPAVLYSNMEHTLFGPQGVTKTFLAIDWACHLAYKRPWMGKPVEHAKSVYVCGEGGGRMFADRLDAWLKHHEIGDDTAANEMLRVTEFPVPLLEDEEVGFLLDLIEGDSGADFIIIDTLGSNFGGGDENAQSDMARFCNALRRIRLTTMAGVLVVHHTGHADRTRPQGANILRRNVDIELRCDRDAEDPTLYGLLGGGELKSRHGKGCGLIPYKLESVDLHETDSLGHDIDSAVIVPTQDIPQFEGQRTSTKRLGKHQAKAISILRSIAQESGQDMEDPDGIFVSSIDWKTACDRENLIRQRQYDVRKTFRERQWITECTGGFKWYPSEHRPVSGRI